MYIYDSRDKILDTIYSQQYLARAGSSDLARDILNGGFILVFRHAEREKWIDLQLYDGQEANENLPGEKSPFKNAVCLSERGTIQANVMGSVMRKLKIPISEVVSSPSCRARQTAVLAFGGHTRIDHVLMHRGVYKETKADHLQKVRNFLLNLKMVEGKNIIISAHNSVVDSDVFDRIDETFKFELEEGGFYVIKKEKDQLILVDQFHSFQDFQRNFQIREETSLETRIAKESI